MSGYTRRNRNPNPEGSAAGAITGAASGAVSNATCDLNNSDVCDVLADVASATLGSLTDSFTPLLDLAGAIADSAFNAAETLPEEPKEKQKVVLYITQNSTTHHTDEIPEALAAMKRAEKRGLEHTELIAVSDPYKDGSSTYEAAFGDKAKNVTWWTDDKSLEPGQVRVNGEVMELGKRGDAVWEDVTASDEDIKKYATNWQKTMSALGMDEETSKQVSAALWTDEEGNPKHMDSGVGAANELMQSVMVMHRAEQGEFELDGIVLSGHHYSGTDTVFGEHADGSYNYQDALSVKDIASLKGVFPTAYSEVSAFQFSACNTHDLGVQDKDGDAVSTNDFLQGTFENLEMASYWEGIAPGARGSSKFGGEFLYDYLKMQGGNETAAKDARYTTNGVKGEMQRSLLNEDGDLEEIDIKRNKGSYIYNDGKHFRGSNRAYTKRTDLKKHLYEKE